eukprot:gene22439-30694_t
MSGVTTNGTGCLSGKQKFIFDGTFIGTSMNSEWTLVAKDLKYDTLEV